MYCNEINFGTEVIRSIVDSVNALKGEVANVNARNVASAESDNEGEYDSIRVINCIVPMPYHDVWDAQHIIFDNMVALSKKMRKRGDYDWKIACEAVILLEHMPVITIGFHGNVGNLLLNEEQLKMREMECIRIERGGDITYHGPGQLVMYPLLSLDKHGLGVKQYVEILEESVIRTLADYGIESGRCEGAPGVWLGRDSDKERKICALGVKCSHSMTMHGIALNVNTDLRGFDAINPCGFVDKGVTSMARELGHEMSMESVKKSIISHFLSLIDP